ncbi:Hypothetical protein SMAX5B_013170, partial [Scophthalmus maximus]
GEVPEGPRGHGVTSPGDTSSRGQSAQDAHQRPPSPVVTPDVIHSGERVCRFSSQCNSAADIFQLIISSSLVE